MWWINEINDYSETYYPILLEIQKSFRENLLIPTWRWDIFGGMPLFGDPLAMLLSPVNWLSLVIDLKWFFPLAILISFLIGVLGMRKMLREFRVSDNMAQFYSVVYMLMPMSIAHLKAGHLNIYEAVSFYPWVIYYLKKWLVKNEIKNSLLLAFAGVLVLFSHPGMFYILMLPFMPLSLYFLIKKKIKIKNYFVFWLVLIGLSAVYILPTLELNQYINRNSLTKEDIVPIWTVKSIIGGLFFPYPKIATIDQEALLYPGIIVGFLAIYGLLGLEKRKKNCVLIFLLVLLIISLGSFTPVYHLWIKLLPFEGVFRVSSRFWYLALLIIVILAAKGTVKIKNKKVIFAIKSLIVFELFIFAVLRLFLPGRYGIINNYSFYDRYFKNSINEFRIYSTTHSLSQKKIAEIKAAIVDGEYPLQLKSYIDNLQKASGYSYNQYSVIHPPYQVSQEKPQPNALMLGRLNVLYVVTPYLLIDPAFTMIDEEQGYILYKNSQFKDYLWSEDREFKLLNYRSFANRVEAEFQIDRNSIVNWGVRNYPGWRVKIDGLEIPLSQKDFWYQFKVGVGKHTFEADFKNELYKIGSLISLITILLVIICFFYLPNKTKKY